MALAIQVNNGADLAKAMATVDVVHKLIAADSELQPEVGTVGIGPGCDYFLAPYALMSRQIKKRACEGGGHTVYEHWLVFSGYKVHEAHRRAQEAMGKHGRGVCQFGSVHDLCEGGVDGRSKPSTLEWTRIREHAWAGGDDVCQKLYAKTMEKACERMGVAVSGEWQQLREATAAAIAPNDAIRAIRVAPLPEWGRVPFGAFTSEEAAEQQAAAEAIARAEEAAEKAHKEQVKREADEARRQRYLPTLIRFKDLPAPDGEAASDACAYVFTTDPFGKEGEFHCPYDRAAGSPFCSMCKLVVEQLANA